MSAEQTPDIERVLAEHEWLQYVEYGPCTCGDPTAFTAATHRAHVAQALAPVLAAAVRDAEQRGYLVAVRLFHEAHPDHCGGECFRYSDVNHALDRGQEVEQ